LLKQHLHAQIGHARDGHAVRLPRKLVNLLDAKHVDLVVHIQAANVLAVALDDIDELVDGRVFAEEDFCVVDAVLCGACTSVGA